MATATGYALRVRHKQPVEQRCRAATHISWWRSSELIERDGAPRHIVARSSPYEGSGG